MKLLSHEIPIAMALYIIKITYVGPSLIKQDKRKFYQRAFFIKIEFFGSSGLWDVTSNNLDLI